jgi:LacI family transcriptional regulator
MARPTIKDVAREAGVSISTVNRILGGAPGVRPTTAKAVKDAAARIGYFGVGTIEARVSAQMPKLKFGFLLLQPNRTFYKLLASALEEAAARVEERIIETEVVFAEDLSPNFLSRMLLELGERCNAVGIVAPVHPQISQAVDALASKKVPVFALISQLSATGSVNYVGLDNWKVGRMSAWAFHKFTHKPGKIGILVGNHRFRCQEMNEAGFRSYFREYAPDFQLLEPISTFETASVAEEMTEKLLHLHPDLSGLFVSGGGISGALAALRSTGKAGQINCVGYQLMDSTRLGLLDGTLTMLISYPLQQLAESAIAGMITASSKGLESNVQTLILPFEIYSRENI